MGEVVEPVLIDTLYAHQEVFEIITDDKCNNIVIYHVTIVAIGHGMLKKFWPFGNRLRSTHCRSRDILNGCFRFSDISGDYAVYGCPECPAFSGFYTHFTNHLRNSARCG